MSRLEELEAIGYKNLKGVEREEYRGLKAIQDGEDSGETKEPVAQMVEVKQDVLEGLLSRIETLEKSNKSFERQAGLQTKLGAWREVEEKKRIHTATLRKWRKDSESPSLLAVDWLFHKDQWNEERMLWEQIYKVKFLKLPVSGEMQHEVVEMPLTQFIMIDDRETVKIIERKVKKLIANVGFVRKRFVDENWETQKGNNVPMTVTKDDTTCTIELPDGTKFDIKEDRLNT